MPATPGTILKHLIFLNLKWHRLGIAAATPDRQVVPHRFRLPLDGDDRENARALSFRWGIRF